MTVLNRNERARARAGRLALALVLLAASGLVAATSAAGQPARGSRAGLTSGGSPPNQGDPDKVITVSSGYACGGPLVDGTKVEGGLGTTITFTTSQPIAQVTVKSGKDAQLVSSSFAADFLSGSITLDKDVSNYIVWTCDPPAAPPPPPPPPPPTTSAKATLTVIKQVINDDGGTKNAADFTLHVTGGNPSPARFAGSAGGTSVVLDAGDYSVSETPDAGYTARYSAGCSGSLAAGGTATCTVTNDDKRRSDPGPPTTNPPTTPGPPSTSGPPLASNPPAPPSPPVGQGTPSIDLAIVKTDAPDPAVVGGRITYTLAVTNKGVVRATNVVVGDRLPSRLQFVSVSTSQGTCSRGRRVTCSLGVLEVGASATVRIVVRPVSPGLVVNTATVRGDERDVNPADNTSSATTRINAPSAPPAARCPQLVVGRRTLTVGRRATIVVRVHLGRLGIGGMRVTVRGAGTSVSGRTDGRGFARVAVRPRRAGIIVVRVAGQPARCGQRRIGVVGIFAAPALTG